MSAESARAFLRAHGFEDRILILEADTATVAAAAAAIGVTPDEIAKTLSFAMADDAILIVAEGTARIDNQKFKQTFSAKARMLPPDQVETLIGHAPGGVCPFGIKGGVKVYFDASLRRHETVYPAAGTDHSAVRLSLQEFEQAVQPVDWVDVTKKPQTETDLIS